jgi:hypothetical protein
MNKPAAIAVAIGMTAVAAFAVSIAVYGGLPGPASKFLPPENPPIGSRQTLINNYVVACRNPYFWDHVDDDPGFDIFDYAAIPTGQRIAIVFGGLSVEDFDMPHRRFRRDRDTAGCLWVPMTANSKVWSLFALPDNG